MIEKPTQARVLLVDDQPLVLEQLRRLMEAQPDIAIEVESRAEDAVETAKRFRPTVILQDLSMPGSDGYELLARYREVEGLANVPVVILSGHSGAAAKERCFDLGACDYVVKLPDAIELLARIRYHSAAFVAREKRDRAFEVVSASQRELVAANAMLAKLNGLDELTGVGNRRSFDAAMAAEWSWTLRHSKPLSLVMCDIDYFKRYNDAFGHVGGDFCLKSIAATLANQLRRPSDKLCRYGGEEFALVLPDTDLAGAMLLAELCRRSVEGLGQAGCAAELKAPVTMSFGVASIVPTRDFRVLAMVEAADGALFEAKRAGRNAVRDAETGWGGPRG